MSDLSTSSNKKSLSIYVTASLSDYPSINLVSDQAGSFPPSLQPVHAPAIKLVHSDEHGNLLHFFDLPESREVSRVRQWDAKFSEDTYLRKDPPLTQVKNKILLKVTLYSYAKKHFNCDPNKLPPPEKTNGSIGNGIDCEGGRGRRGRRGINPRSVSERGLNRRSFDGA